MILWCQQTYNKNRITKLIMTTFTMFSKRDFFLYYYVLQYIIILKKKIIIFFKFSNNTNTNRLSGSQISIFKNKFSVVVFILIKQFFFRIYLNLSTVGTLKTQICLIFLKYIRFAYLYDLFCRFIHMYTVSVRGSCKKKMNLYSL